MRDISNRRARLDHLRRELLAAYADPNATPESVGEAASRLRLVLHEKPGMNLIDDDRAKVVRAALEGGESLRTTAALAGVAKGTVERYKREIDGARQWSEPPTADHVAVAIVAAAKETDANPIEVAEGVLATAGNHSGKVNVSRARAYAALALRAVFDNVPTKSIAGWVGAGSPAVYCASIDHQIRHKMIKWWSDDAFMRVIAAIEAHSEKALA